MDWYGLNSIAWWTWFGVVLVWTSAHSLSQGVVNLGLGIIIVLKVVFGKR